MAKTMDKHKKSLEAFKSGVKDIVSGGHALSSTEVQARNERCKAANVCYVSLAPLTDENVFTLTTKEGQFSMLKKYGEKAMQ